LSSVSAGQIFPLIKPLWISGSFFAFFGCPFCHHSECWSNPHFVWNHNLNGLV
jgi:hypothetical protein